MPKEPRMAMINMMYLVLTAMLALNITKEVINAFSTINDSIERSNSAISGKNSEIYTEFDNRESKPDEAAKVKPLNDRAKIVKAETDQIVAYLQTWKDSVIAVSGGMVLDDFTGNQKVANIDNIDASTTLFVKNKNGDVIRKEIQDYAQRVLAQIPDEAERNNIAAQFPVKLDDLPKTEDNPNGEWSHGTFNNIPVIASVALFSKFTNDIKNGEAMILQHLQNQIGKDDYKFDALQAIAVANTSYALKGQDIEAKILLAAYNSTDKNLKISSSAGAVTVQDGVGVLKFKANGIGNQTVSGTIVTTKGGKEEKYDYKFQYTVGTSGASMQLDQMNVMYIGVPNPVTLSASGYNIEDVSLNVPEGVTKAAVPGKSGSYSINVTKAGTFDFKISATDRGGANTPLMTIPIRVKFIPDPVVTLMKKTGGNIASNQIAVQLGLSAEVPGFDFAATFRVTEFSYIIVKKNDDPVTGAVKGPLFPQDLKDHLKRVRPGDMVIFSNVKAVGPDNKVRNTNPLSFTII